MYSLTSLTTHQHTSQQPLPSPGPQRPAVLTDVVDGAGAELAEELLGAERLQVVDHHRPQVEHVVAAEAVALLEHDHPRAEQLRLDGRSQAARAAADHQHLADRVSGDTIAR